MRGKRMAEKSYCHLAPFGGITRIRFKGTLSPGEGSNATLRRTPADLKRYHSPVGRDAPIS